MLVVTVNENIVQKSGDLVQTSRMERTTCH